MPSGPWIADGRICTCIARFEAGYPVWLNDVSMDWHGREESNLGLRFQRPPSCHWTTPVYARRNVASRCCHDVELSKRRGRAARYGPSSCTQSGPYLLRVVVREESPNEKGPSRNRPGPSLSHSEIPDRYQVGHLLPFAISTSCANDAHPDSNRSCRHCSESRRRSRRARNRVPRANARRAVVLSDRAFIGSELNAKGPGSSSWACLAAFRPLPKNYAEPPPKRHARSIAHARTETRRSFGAWCSSCCCACVFMWEK